MSANSAYIDGFFGDGGKGNVLSVIYSDAAERVSAPVGTGKQILVYSNVGGNNAANSFYFNGQEFVLRQVPGGLLVNAVTFSQMGEEKFISPRLLKKEIETLCKRDLVITPETLGIAPNSHVTLDFHIQNDLQNLRMEGEHRSTGNGILQTAADKYARKGLRFVEFIDDQLMKQVLRDTHPELGVSSINNLVDSYAPEREFLAPFIKQDHLAFREHGQQYKFAQNAHGFGLDINTGLYPGVTSSHPAKVPRWANTVFGIFKLYISSVGARDRAFVSRMPLELESNLRNEWGERGKGTGKDRMLGWFDLVLARYAVDVAGIDYIITTSGDRLAYLSSLGVKPELVVAYELEGKRYEEWQESFHRRDILHKVKPVTITFNSWDQFTEADRQTLTPNAQKYIHRIESELGKEIVMLMQGGKGKQDAVIKTHPLNL